MSYGLSSQAEYIQVAHEQAERHRLLLQNGGYTVSFRTANHYDFADSPLYSPLIGSGSSKQMYDKRDNIILAYFDKHLKGQAAPVPEQSGSGDPDFSVEVIPRSSTAK